MLLPPCLLHPKVTWDFRPWSEASVECHECNSSSLVALQLLSRGSSAWNYAQETQNGTTPFCSGVFRHWRSCLLFVLLWPQSKSIVSKSLRLLFTLLWRKKKHKQQKVHTAAVSSLAGESSVYKIINLCWAQQKMWLCAAGLAAGGARRKLLCVLWFRSTALENNNTAIRKAHSRRVRASFARHRSSLESRVRMTSSGS